MGAAEGGPQRGRGDRATMTSQSDTVCVSLNGHLVPEPVPGDTPESPRDCPRCGGPTILSCPGCREPILGVPSRPQQDPGQEGFTPPRYCHCCGRPFPWTERVVSAVRMAIRQVGALDHYERDQLRRCVDHLIHETPQTRLAVLRVNAALSRIGGDAATALRELFVSIASENVKQQLLQSGQPPSAAGG